MIFDLCYAGFLLFIVNHLIYSIIKKFYSFFLVEICRYKKALNIQKLINLNNYIPINGY